MWRKSFCGSGELTHTTPPRDGMGSEHAPLAPTHIPALAAKPSCSRVRGTSQHAPSPAGCGQRPGDVFLLKIKQSQANTHLAPLGGSKGLGRGQVVLDALYIYRMKPFHTPGPAGCGQRPGARGRSRGGCSCPAPGVLRLSAPPPPAGWQTLCSVQKMVDSRAYVRQVWRGHNKLLSQRAQEALLGPLSPANQLSLSQSFCVNGRHCIGQGVKAFNICSAHRSWLWPRPMHAKSPAPGSRRGSQMHVLQAALCLAATIPPQHSPVLALRTSPMLLS